MTIDPTWVTGAENSGFGSDHLPFARFIHSGIPCAGVRIGNWAFNLTTASAEQVFAHHFSEGDLTTFMQSGPRVWDEVRTWLQEILRDDVHREFAEMHLIDIQNIELLMPVDVGDYTDFYASENHASNVGKMFRPDAPPLLPNWKHMPVSYHGRAGTMVVSGTPIRRPRGQYVSAPSEPPMFGPCQRLDIEAELGFVIGGTTSLGHPIPVDEAESYIFGIVGLNDWSARDIQAWEYVPLGPNLGKSFATTISAWVTPWSAVGHAMRPLGDQDPKPLPHLAGRDLSQPNLEVSIIINGELLAKAPYESMYWSPTQMLAHMTSNGASIRTGDIFGSGTISGSTIGERGSLLEITWNGTETWGPHQQTFLRDGDEVILEYECEGEFGPLRLGSVSGTILAANG
jgi:fumarylacetoacetase